MTSIAEEIEATVRLRVANSGIKHFFDVQRQWAPFVKRTRRPDLHELAPVIERLDQFLWPVLEATAQGDVWRYRWPNGGPWKAL